MVLFQRSLVPAYCITDLQQVAARSGLDLETLNRTFTAVQPADRPKPNSASCLAAQASRVAMDEAVGLEFRANLPNVW